MPTTITLIKQAAERQQIGDYKAGLIELQEAALWDYEYPNSPPNTAGLTDLEAAELHVSAGRLYGFYGIIYKNAQEVSKNLLTAAYELLAEIDNCDELRRICSNHLALAYWRMGAMEEAQNWISNSSALDLPADSRGRLHTFIVDSLVDLSSGRFNDVLLKFGKEKGNFKKSGDPYLLGLFYMNRGVAKRNTGDLDGALADQLTARDTFHSLGHRQLVAYSENNISLFYKSVGNFTKALEYARRSLFAAEQAEDVRQTGCVNDTLALLYFDQGKYKKALTFANRSVEILERTECYKYLFDSRRTKIEILFKLEQPEEALELYADTLVGMRPYCVSECAKLTQMVNGYFSERVFPKIRSITRKIEITTDHHAHLGLKKGCIAHVQEAEVVNGDFVAVKHLVTKKYYLGVLDSHFGLVNLDIGKTDPRPFDEADIEILGKVVKYSAPDGKVMPFQLKYLPRRPGWRRVLPGNFI